MSNLADSPFQGDGGLYDEIANKLLNSQYATGEIPQNLYFETARQLMQAIGEGLGASTFNYDDSRNILQSYLTRNIFHFSAAKSLTELIEFRNRMTDPETGEVLPFHKFRKQIAEAGKLFNETWLRTEFDTAKQSAIMAHRWNTLDAEYLQYSTVGDSRVRPEHAALDGKTYPKDHPFWARGFPPLSYNCRCTVVPGIASKYNNANQVQDEKYVSGLVKNTIFDNNVGITKLVFTNQHPYYENLTTGETKALTWKNYGMKSMDSVKTRLGVSQSATLSNKDEYDNLFRQLTNHRDGIVLKDPLGQNVLFANHDLRKTGRPSDSFKQHLLTRKEDAERFKLAANMNDVLKNPDEIWSVVNNAFKQPITTHYIKYYNDKVLLIIAEENEAKTMFDLTKSDFASRNGILLYRK